MKSIKNSRAVRDYAMITAGCCLMALASKLLFDPGGMVTGGFSGLAIIVKKMTGSLVSGGIPLWLTNILLNIPFFPLAWKLKGWSFIKRTVYATTMFSFWLAVIPEVALLPERDLFLYSVFGGIIMGIGIGMVFAARATTGGTDMVGAILQCKLRHFSIAQIMQVLDAFIMIIGVFTFGIQMTLYAFVAIYLTAKISDGIIEGMNFAKLAYIISDKYEEIAKQILTEMDRGVTALNGVGMYSMQKKNILLCVVSKKELVTIKEIVSSIDEKAFVIVNDSREVLGEGFVQY